MIDDSGKFERVQNYKLHLQPSPSTSKLSVPDNESNINPKSSPDCILERIGGKNDEKPSLVASCNNNTNQMHILSGKEVRKSMAFSSSDDGVYSKSYKMGGKNIHIRSKLVNTIVPSALKHGNVVSIQKTISNENVYRCSNKLSIHSDSTRLSNFLLHSQQPTASSTDNTLLKMVQNTKTTSENETTCILRHPEKSDTCSIKQPSVYIPRSNRPTRYPIRPKPDFCPESLKSRTFHHLHLKSDNTIPLDVTRGNCSGNPSSKSNKVVKTSLKNVIRINQSPSDRVATIDIPNNVSTLNFSTGSKKIHNPAHILPNNRSKMQTRIFLPEKLDFSQLSTEAHINISRKLDTAMPSYFDSDAKDFSRSTPVHKLDSANFEINELIDSTNYLPNSVPLNASLDNEKFVIKPFANAESDNVNPTKPLSLAKVDLQNWIKSIIDIKDSITAAYLISSHIFEKTSQAIAQRHEGERRESERQLNAKISNLLEANDNLQRQLIHFHNPQCANKYEIWNSRPKIIRISSLPIEFPVKQSFIHEQLPRSTFEGTSKSSLNNFVVNGNNSPSDLFTASYPSPPPDLPEVASKLIPLPPPNLPDIPNLDAVSPITCNAVLQLGIFPKQKNKKQSIMKPLHWQRICLPGRKNKQDIIWKALPKSKIRPNDILAFEDLFSTQKTRKHVKPISALNLRSSIPQEIFSLDISRQIGVIFKNIESMNVNFEDIAEMLYSGDMKTSNLTTSILENLCKLVTDERIEMVRLYTSKNPNSELSKESKAIHYFCDIPNVNMRFCNMLYMEKFEEELQHIHRNIFIISNCCSKLKNSHELKILLSIVLLLGNHMNQNYDSFKDAVGFNLELLPRLKETKSVDNRTTFLDFVSRCYLLTFEHNILDGTINNILPFPDTGDLFIASKVTLRELFSELSNLGEQLTKIRENTRHFLEDSTKSTLSKFGENVEEFFLFAEKKIASEIELWKVGEKTYKELIYYFYGETKEVWNQHDKCDLFELWCTFACSFKEALLKEHKKIIIRRRNDFNKSGTKIIPLCPSGLKQRVKLHSGNKVKFLHTSKSLNVHKF